MTIRLADGALADDYSAFNSASFRAMAYFSASIPSPVTAEMAYSSSFLRLQKRFSLASLSLLAASIFEATDDGRLGIETRAEAGQLARDDLEVFDRVGTPAGVGHVNQMHQQSCALDVAQKLRAQPGAGVRAFDQAGNIGDHEADS